MLIDVLGDCDFIDFQCMVAMLICATFVFDLHSTQRLLQHPWGVAIFLRRFSKGMTHLQWVGPSRRPFGGRQVGRPIVG